MRTTEAVSTTVLSTAVRSRSSVKTNLKLDRPTKCRSPGLRTFHWSVEMTSVATNGSCVTTMVKTSAGSSGMRRFHLPAPADGRGRLGGGAVSGVR